jgi:hypothetical protein
MNALLLMVAVGLQTYQAKVDTFGCYSKAEFAALNNIRSKEDEFEKLLYTNVMYGQCVVIAQGVIVSGSMQSESELLVGADVNPLGFITPSGDFDAKGD